MADNDNEALEVLELLLAGGALAREYRRGWNDALQKTGECLIEEGGSRSFPFIWKYDMPKKLAALIK